jgi:hypothetical protein
MMLQRNVRGEDVVLFVLIGVGLFVVLLGIGGIVLYWQWIALYWH